MDLHDAIKMILDERPTHEAPVKEIADEIWRRGLYAQKVGAEAPAKQVLRRAELKPKLFVVSGGINGTIRLV